MAYVVASPNRWLESNPNYRDPKSRSMYIPLGPWKEGKEDRILFCYHELKKLCPDMSEREQYISALMREDCIRILGNFKPLLLGDGQKEADVDQWVAVSFHF